MLMLKVLFISMKLNDNYTEMNVVEDYMIWINATDLQQRKPGDFVDDTNNYSKTHIDYQ